MNAVVDGDDARVRRLLDDGAEPDDVDKAGWCALHFAAQECSEKMVKMLVKAGANLELREKYGNTPLWRAVSNYRGGAEVISTLLEVGANPDAENKSGVSPREMANTIANYDTAKFFENY
ncbi:MAG: ankyrin repeat domain-containing protein [Silicimonas sp.]|nr:ankyrin repeat domain-containing protein [Silicimonas sp.]NND41955.1 ankyrin repeat domain-containing protein [Silicimonas sp.]NNL73637.1 ankyrin repeat domain-containing protein [Silicimonas sp.]